MKKRGQSPDSYTYGLILRGLADALDARIAVGKALSIYSSMQAPNSPLKPSVTHVNLVLKVCARAKDMDSLWTMASKLPERGIGAPDAITWTTILNAIRYEAETISGPLMTSEQVFQRKQKAVIEGRRIWGDLVEKWRVGELQIDEQLVGAMGMLLLLGSQPRDWDDILSLVRQTMNIPRMAPRVPAMGEGTEPKNPDGEIASPKLLEDGQNKDDDLERGPKSDSETSSEFEVLVVARPARREKPEVHTVAYARPANTTLSLLVAACERLFNKKAAAKYWEYFHQSVGITPDAQNYHAYLRVLRIMRAGGEALDIVRKMSESREIKLEPKTFRIAMSACGRDKINPHSFDHANQLMELMKTHLESGYDPVSMISYLEVAQYNRDRSNILHALRTVSELVDRHVQKHDVPKPRKEANKTKAARLTRDLLRLGELAGMLERGFVRFLNRSGEDRKRQDEYREEIEKWSALRQRVSRLTKGLKAGKEMMSIDKKLRSGLL